MAGHQDIPALPAAGGRSRHGSLPAGNRPAARHVLQRAQGRLAARSRGRAGGAGRRRACGDGDRRLLAALEPHRWYRGRPPRHRRLQRLPDHADGPRDPGLERQVARRHEDPSFHDGRDRSFRRQGGTGSRSPRGGSDLGHPGRPARRPVRADLLPPGRGQEHLRDRLLPVDEHRRRDGPLHPRPAHHDRVPDRR